MTGSELFTIIISNIGIQVEHYCLHQQQKSALPEELITTVVTNQNIFFIGSYKFVSYVYTQSSATKILRLFGF